MDFDNSKSHIKEASDYAVKRVTLLFIFSFIVGMTSIWLTMRNYDNRNFVVLTTLIFGGLSGITGILIGRRTFKRSFLSYRITLDDEQLQIKSNHFNKKLDLNTITKITQLRNGTLFIHQRFFQKITISRFIENREIFITELQKIKPIDETSNSKQYLQYLPLVFYFALQLSRVIGSYWYYFIVGSLFVITAFISIFQTVLSGLKGIASIITILFFGYLIYAISKNLYVVSSHLF